MSVVRDVRDGTSALRVFLDHHLPGRAVVANEWAAALKAVPRHGERLRWDREVVGRALEVRIGLDVADRPGYWDDLAFLSAAECRTLLMAAGFTHPELDDGEPVCSDPLHRCWQRASRTPSDAPWDEALRACLDAAELGAMLHESRHTLSVEECRNSCRLLRSIWSSAGWVARRSRALDGFRELWSRYLTFGRDGLVKLGSRVVLEPVLAIGYARADMVIGHTLVEVKVQLEPWDHAGQSLDQLLAYLLLDRWNSLALDAIALYAGWEAAALVADVHAVLTAVTSGPTPDLQDLRSDFRDAMREPLGWGESLYLGRLFDTGGRGGT
jgi:hypothetical protein